MSSMIYNNLPTDGKSNACTLVIITTVETLKYVEYLFSVFLIKSYSIILHAEECVFAIRCRLAKFPQLRALYHCAADLYNWFFIRFMEFQSIAD